MKLLTGFDLLETIARGVGSPVMEVSFDNSLPYSELSKAAPWLFDVDGSSRFATVPVALTVAVPHLA